MDVTCVSISHTMRLALYTTCSVCTPDTQHIPHVHTFNNAGLQLAAVPAPEHDVNMTDMTYCMFKEEHINLQCESHL